MNDLISRKKVIEILEKEKSLRCGYDADITIFSIEKGIRELSTSYSVDKVVEELEENASRYTKKYTTPYGNNGYKDTKAINVNKAIEIVKQGGVSDDVCEWNQHIGGVGLKAYNISCCDKTLEMPVSTARELKYCPYCGKKIKIVGD